MSGLIKIYFGKVVDVNDNEKINRCKISIPGYTDKINIEDLPWYFPFFGLKYLPVKNDIVPVLIFNDNIVSGFYNNKIDLISNDLSGTEYENYVELYKRLGVIATYKESEGWLFVNKESKIQIDKKQITIISEKINHNSGEEPMVLGNKLFSILERLCDAIILQTHTTPSGPSGPPINKSTYQSIKNDLDIIKSELSFLQ